MLTSMRHLEKRSYCGFKKIKIFFGIIIWVGFTSNKRVLEVLYWKKAIYKRNSESLSNIVNLANLAVEEEDKEMAVQF
jgi:hypothetical protein